MLNWFKSFSNFTGLDGFCLVVELHWGGSATNRATTSNFNYLQFGLSKCGKMHVQKTKVQVLTWTIETLRKGNIKKRRNHFYENYSGE